MRRWLLYLLVATLIGGVAGTIALSKPRRPETQNDSNSAASAPIASAALGLGDAIFWEGVAGASIETLAYDLEIEEGERLRVALDTSRTPGAGFELKLWDPSGIAAGVKKGAVSQELFVDSPQPGLWRVLIHHAPGTESAYRLRAKLENENDTAVVDRGLPNLRVEPPYDFHLRLPPPHEESCWPSEKRKAGVNKCLRFAVGPQNIGTAPLMLFFSSESTHVLQRVTRGQSERERRAGSYEFHELHNHFHFADFLELRLYRVEGKRLVAVSSGVKRGFCFDDFALANWRRFLPDSAEGPETRCEDSEQGLMRLSPGWAEVYPWTLVDNFIDFTQQPDGEYVVTAIVDPSDTIAESNEADNRSFALVEVAQGDIRLLERGFGASPLDPQKRLVRR